MIYVPTNTDAPTNTHSLIATPTTPHCLTRPPARPLTRARTQVLGMLEEATREQRLALWAAEVLKYASPMTTPVRHFWQPPARGGGMPAAGDVEQAWLIGILVALGHGHASPLTGAPPPPHAPGGLPREQPAGGAEAGESAETRAADAAGESAETRAADAGSGMGQQASPHEPLHVFTQPPYASHALDPGRTGPGALYPHPHTPTHPPQWMPGGAATGVSAGAEGVSAGAEATARREEGGRQDAGGSLGATGPGAQALAPRPGATHSAPAVSDAAQATAAGAAGAGHAHAAAAHGRGGGGGGGRCVHANAARRSGAAGAEAAAAAGALAAAAGAGERGNGAGAEEQREVTLSRQDLETGGTSWHSSCLAAARRPSPRRSALLRPPLRRRRVSAHRCVYVWRKE